MAKSNLDVLLPQLGDAFTGKTRISVHANISGKTDLPGDVIVAFYRITQEAFNNISKHANATQIHLTLRQQMGQVSLIVQGNGRGFEKTAVSGEHMGLSIMQERATQIGAQLEIDSEPNRGTQISLLWTTEENEVGDHAPN